MDYEKAYKEALERAEKAMRGSDVTNNDAILFIFPELEESEDERIRKEIVDYLKDFIPHNDLDLVRKSKVWIEWLEKQGEQKPIESDWVDLGLPSGTLWKSSNETNPKFYTYVEAIEKFGDQLPTKEQWEELKNNCQWAWADNGYKVTGPNGNSIFLPAAGYRFLNGDVVRSETYGSYWASNPSNSTDAWSFDFKRLGVGIYSYDRCLGQSVRLVNSTSKQH